MSYSTEEDPEATARKLTIWGVVLLVAPCLIGMVLSGVEGIEPSRFSKIILGGATIAGVGMLGQAWRLRR